MRGAHQRFDGWLRGLSRRGVLLFATIPFALLANSSQVQMNVTVERDGGALRQIIAAANPYFKDQLPKYVNDVGAGGGWDRKWQRGDGTLVTYARDFRIHDANFGGGRLQIEDVLQNPLSLYTTYTWTEEVSFAYTSDADAAMASAGGKCLAYTLRMPGTVQEASTQPSAGSKASTEGNSAEFVLSAASPKVTVTAVSTKTRWGYLLVVLYVLAWVALEIMRVLGRLARLRPRKI